VTRQPIDAVRRRHRGISPAVPSRHQSGGAIAASWVVSAFRLGVGVTAGRVRRRPLPGSDHGIGRVVLGRPVIALVCAPVSTGAEPPRLQVWLPHHPPLAWG
jgi:hypothetical protein